MEEVDIAAGWVSVPTQELTVCSKPPTQELTVCSKPPTSQRVAEVAAVVQTVFSAAQQVASAFSAAASSVFTRDPAELLIQKLASISYPFQDTQQYKDRISSLKSGICTDSGASSKIMIVMQFVCVFIESLLDIKEKCGKGPNKEMHEKLCSMHDHLFTYFSSLEDVRKEKRKEARDLIISLTYLFA